MNILWLSYINSDFQQKYFSHTNHVMFSRRPAKAFGDCVHQQLLWWIGGWDSGRDGPSRYILSRGSCWDFGHFAGTMMVIWFGVCPTEFETCSEKPEYLQMFYTVPCNLVGGDWNMNFRCSFSWEFHHPNWQTHIFQRGRYTTNQQSLGRGFGILRPDLMR